MTFHAASNRVSHSARGACLRVCVATARCVSRLHGSCTSSCASSHRPGRASAGLRTTGTTASRSVEGEDERAARHRWLHGMRALSARGPRAMAVSPTTCSQRRGPSQASCAAAL